MELDINKLLNSIDNTVILNLFKNTKYYEFFKLLNKYGIQGLDVFGFTLELEQIIKKIDLNNNSDEE